MLAGAGYGHTVKHGEKIEVQQAKQVFRCPLPVVKFAPFVEGGLGVAEDEINGL